VDGTDAARRRRISGSRQTDPEVPVPDRTIDDSLLQRVRETLATTSRRSEIGALSVQRRAAGSRTVFAVAGEIDLATAPRLRAAVEAALASGSPEICIDLSATTFMDTAGLHLLVDARRRAVELDRTMTIASPSAAVLRVIEVAGFTELLEPRHAPSDHAAPAA
jgi:anti-sigma B factor antagonist